MDLRSEVLLRQVDYLQGPLLLAGLPADSKPKRVHVGAKKQGFAIEAIVMP